MKLEVEVENSFYPLQGLGGRKKAIPANCRNGLLITKQ